MAVFTLQEQDAIREAVREEVSNQLREVVDPLWKLVGELRSILDGQQPGPESPLQALADRVTAVERRLYAAGIR